MTSEPTVGQWVDNSWVKLGHRVIPNLEVSRVRACHSLCGASTARNVCKGVLPRSATHSADYVVERCPAVRLSVCLRDVHVTDTRTYLSFCRLFVSLCVYTSVCLSACHVHVPYVVLPANNTIPASYVISVHQTAPPLIVVADI